MIRVGIADGHPIVRGALRNLLSGQQGVVVVGDACDGHAALELARSMPLDILLIDLALLGQSSLEVFWRIRTQAPEVAILVFTGYAHDQFVVSLFRQGVSGFLRKNCDLVEIVTAIRVISAGGRYISPTVADQMAAELHGDGKEPHDKLSEREFQVFLRLASGQRSGVIARALSLSVKTVSTYRARVLEKLQLTSNGDLTSYAVKHQLLDEPKTMWNGYGLMDLARPR
ncbi:response regulator transcription factor [Variovorax sp. J22R133]|uniref:response regulator n=1 Tax=Variovorax brevis TaxID=3053503 RepID=UPI002578EAB7|nr:response regulator transcription factor [Variovorax sp. J22R133]MDM0116586.1 response regulator transcription factor [Variovorax sp. J22R133]